MGKAHFEVLLLCLYMTDNGISFDGHFLKHSSWIPNLKHIPFDLHGPFPVWNLLVESSPLLNKDLTLCRGNVITQTRTALQDGVIPEAVWQAQPAESQQIILSRGWALLSHWEIITFWNLKLAASSTHPSLWCCFCSNISQMQQLLLLADRQMQPICLLPILAEIFA